MSVEREEVKRNSMYSTEMLESLTESPSTDKILVGRERERERGLWHENEAPLNI